MLVSLFLHVHTRVVMNEMRKLMISADFLQIHPMIFVGVQECKVLLYWWDVIAMQWDVIATE